MSKITKISQLDLSKQYTYADYITWRLAERVELIKGWLYKMSPAPKTEHQRISAELDYYIMNYFKTNKLDCSVFSAPFDVRLVKNKGQANQEIDTVVQPDICIICDKEKLDERGCVGAPDLIVEILSPSTSKKDYNEKYFLYEENKVKEYWIANPDAKSIEVFALQEGKYFSIGVFNELDGYTEVYSKLFPEMKFKLKEIFENSF